VGTLWNRVRFQDEYDTFIVVADQHMLTTRLDRLGDIEANIRDDVLGNLAVGLDPDKATIYLQSRVPQTAELFLYLAMLVSVSRVQRTPTLKEVLRESRIAGPSYGLLGYPILQAADFLLLLGDIVPVGRDQLPHIELAREIARGFNDRFAAIFPIPVAHAPDSGSLPGTDGASKMSRSAGNTIDLFDDAATIRGKVMSMYTDPTRQRATDPGHVDGNPVFAYLDAFEADRDQLADLRQRYLAGRVGDVEVKHRLASVIDSVLAPIRQRRQELLAENPTVVEDVLRAGTARARAEAAETIDRVRTAMRLDYFA
jgi:tryptophanyl-tRNA synthetase